MEIGGVIVAMRIGVFRRGIARIVPYALAEQGEDREERRDEEAEPGGEAARQYGIWWHGLMESLAWQKGPSAWKPVFDARIGACPQPGRGREEWRLFLASDTATRLAQKQWIVHAELPFLVARGDGTCVEGVMDAALLDEKQGRWWLIDWKTNRTDAGGAPALRDIYAPQLAAYAEALRAVTGLAVEGGVYSTATGLWIPCGEWDGAR